MQSLREQAPTWAIALGRPPLRANGMNVAQSALPFSPLTVIANAWQPSWLYEQPVTVHSLTAGIAMVVMSPPQGVEFGVSDRAITYPHSQHENN
jgi:hypothetical protein